MTTIKAVLTGEQRLVLKPFAKNAERARRAYMKAAAELEVAGKTLLGDQLGPNDRLNYDTGIITTFERSAPARPQAEPTTGGDT
jgi:hypothetical protein